MVKLGASLSKADAAVIFNSIDVDSDHKLEVHEVDALIERLDGLIHWADEDEWATDPYIWARGLKGSIVRGSSIEQLAGGQVHDDSNYHSVDGSPLIPLIYQLVDFSLGGLLIERSKDLVDYEKVKSQLSALMKEPVMTERDGTISWEEVVLNGRDAVGATVSEYLRSQTDAVMTHVLCVV